MNYSVRTQLANLPLKMRLSIARSIAAEKGAMPLDVDYRRMLMTRNEDERNVGYQLYRSDFQNAQI